MDNLPEISCDLLVIGSGITGMAAALFAANLGIDTVQVGRAGELGFASGFLDLLGVHPVEDGRIWDRPFDGIGALVAEHPRHPYAFLDKKDIQSALSGFVSFLAAHGLPYYTEPGKNLAMITPTGTLKTTYAVPATVQNGVRALAEKASCLVVDFHGLKGFSGRQIVETLDKTWPNLTTRRISFPDTSGELLPEHMALSLESPECRAQLAGEIAPHIHSAEYVALPAILGMYRPMAVFEDLQKQLNRPVFEIPTMPPAIGGLRIKAAFEKALPRLFVRTHYQQKITAVDKQGRNGFRFDVGRDHLRRVITAKGAILASGRFIGGGLTTDRKSVRETLFNLPVFQPVTRSEWHQKSFLDPRGHPINRFGITTDDQWRPLNNNRHPAIPGLFAAGSILAHQDWVRQKCGAGLGITTAFAAVNAFQRFISG
ncbi:MAG: anaerobic glycerol-3-phosphate dehydrogenase subunit B [Deltaproteobacteria bacterium]|nr:MAG: anaerobic glycerol-3-phosphate dehydrogenase subunit B [Deltaproteobacteria bacterium]